MACYLSCLVIYSRFFLGDSFWTKIEDLKSLYQVVERLINFLIKMEGLSLHLQFNLNFKSIPLQLMSPSLLFL